MLASAEKLTLRKTQDAKRKTETKLRSKQMKKMEVIAFQHKLLKDAD